MTIYSRIGTWAQYSPWDDDGEFQHIWNDVRGKYTLLDIYRCWELFSLARDMSLREGNILEVGCWKGGSGMFLSQGTIFGNIYLCDTFSGVVKAGEHDNQYRGGEHADATFWGVINLAQELGQAHVTVLDGIFPDETGEKVKDCKFKLVHIDVDVYQGAKDITQWVWDKLTVGGVIIYDDYGFVETQGVRKYVDELRIFDDRLVIYNLNGHALVIKLR